MIWDRRLDQLIIRTSARPFAAGTISMTQAAWFLLALGLIGLFVLIQLPRLAIYVGLAAAPLVVLYPLAKRVTWFPVRARTNFFMGSSFGLGCGCRELATTLYYTHLCGLCVLGIWL